MANGDSNNLTINLTRTTAIIALVTPLALVVGQWFVFGYRMDRVEADAAEAKRESRDATAALGRVDVRLERIQTTLEQIVKGHDERIKSLEGRPR